MLQFCLLQDDWSLKHTTIPKTAAQTLHFSFHSVNFGDQFPSPNLDFSWFFWEITFSLVSPPFLFVLSQRETTAAPMNQCHSTQGRWRSVEGFGPKPFETLVGTKIWEPTIRNLIPKRGPKYVEVQVHFFSIRISSYGSPHNITSETHSQSVFAGQRLPFKKKNTCNDENPVICLTPMVLEALVALETDRKIGWHEPAG